MAKRRPSGDGMVRKREDGRWEGRIVTGHKENGDPIFQYVLAPTQKELLEKLHRNIETFHGVELCENSKMTLAQWLDRWLAKYASVRLRDSTMVGYRIYAEQYINPRLGSKKMTAITTADIQRMYTKLKKEGRVREHPEHGRQLSANTIRRIHAMLHRALADAVRAHVIPCNPANGVTLPKVDAVSKRVLTDREMDAFMAVIGADPVWHDFFYTELTTGLRRGGDLWTPMAGLRCGGRDAASQPHPSPGSGRRVQHRRDQDREGETKNPAAGQYSGTAAGEKENRTVGVDLPQPGQAKTARHAHLGLPPAEISAEAGGAA